MSKYEFFKEISSINQEIRKSIHHSMPKQYRIDIGIEILQCMRHLKLLAYYLCYDIISEDDFKTEWQVMMYAFIAVVRHKYNSDSELKELIDDFINELIQNHFNMDIVHKALFKIMTNEENYGRELLRILQ